MEMTKRTGKPIHQIRLGLFEMGLHLTPLQIDFFISKARRETLKKLQFAALSEGLMDRDWQAYCPLHFLSKMKALTEKRQQSARFWAWSQFEDEIESSMHNLSLSLAYRYTWDKRLKEENPQSLWAWALEAISSHERTIFFEQWGSEGHPYHPNSKAKMGMSSREVLMYSPEFQSRIDIDWLAIDKRFAKASILDIDRMLNLNFPKQMAFWREGLRRVQKTPAHYHALPVHPWQLEHKLPALFKEQFDEGLILSVGVKQTVSPTMSFRTVAGDSPSSPHIKLATGVHTTSAMRTVSPASVHNGPKLSHVLKMILSTEKHFDNTLYVLHDLGGIHAEHTEGKHLSSLFRENPTHYLDKDETAVVVGALFSRSPITHRPLLMEIMDASGLAPYDYFERYCDCLLPGQMVLYLKYGLALESHQQNTFMVFNHQHLPSKQLNRDLGGIRVKRSLLKRQGYFMLLDASVAIDTEDDNELRNKFIHANLQSHLSYVIDAMVKHCPGICADVLWAKVKQKMVAVLDTLAPVLGETRYQKEKNGLFNMPWQLKSLLRMRLEPCHGRYLYRTTDNPLKG